MTRIYIMLFMAMILYGKTYAQSTSDFAASASPDGKSIVYYSYRDGKAEIYKMDADGRNQTRLTFNQEGHDFEPAWSPKGNRIAYIASSQKDPADFEIMLMDSDGGNLQNLTDHPGNDFSPAWSPDGNSIAFHSNRDGNEEIYVMSVADRVLTRITHADSQDNYASWSHDGRYLSFVSDRDGGKSQIHIYDFRTKTTKRLTSGDLEEFGARWSPKEHQLVFTSKVDGDNEVFVVNMDGTGLRNVSDNYEQDFFPSWSADGKQIYFTSSLNGGDEIYRIDLQSGEQVNLTNTSTYNGNPSFSADGDMIYFNSKRDLNLEIYHVGLNGRGEQRITSTPNAETGPVGSSKELFYEDGGDIYRLNRRNGKAENLTGSAANEHSPAVSQDGKWLLYSSNEGGAKDHIYRMNLRNGKTVQLTSAEADDGGATWSADGSKIVFHRIVGRQVDVWLMDSDGGNQEKLSDGTGASYNPAISPDNNEVVFVSNRDGRRFRELYKLNLKSKALTRLTRDHGRNDLPRWSGNGGQIVFESSKDGNHQIFLMNSDGSNKQQLTFLK